MTSYVKFVLLWMVLTKGLESYILHINIPSWKAIWIFNNISCPLPSSGDLKKNSNSESTAKCSLTVDYVETERRKGYHEKNLYLQSEEKTLSTRRKLHRCHSEFEQVFHFVCTISEIGSIGDICISNQNCVNNTVCSIKSFYGRCICQEGLKEYNKLCVKEKVKLGEQCYYKKQCEQSHAACNNQRCSCVSGYIEVENNCVEGNKAAGSRCQYHEQCTATPNTGLCQGNSSYLMCSCKSGFVKVKGSCIENLKLGETCNSNDQCRLTNAKCSRKKCSCKKGYIQIENNCVEENKTLGSQCQYHKQCTKTPNAGLCVGNSSYLKCSCDAGFVEINRSCIGNLKLGENCSNKQQCQQSYATCRANQCSCKGGYLQIENNCVEGNKALNVPCTYHEQCTGSPNASLCVGNASAFICRCIIGFVESNGSCIELSEHVASNIVTTFFDTKASLAIFSGIISFIVGVSLTVLVFAVYRNKSRYVESGQNLMDQHQLSNKRGFSCSTTCYHISQDDNEKECKTNDNKNSEAGIEVAHQENDRNQSDHDCDPCLYNHLNEEDELECAVENNYDTAQNELQNDSENSYASVQSRKGSSKQLIVDDVYMPVIVENEL